MKVSVVLLVMKTLLTGQGVRSIATTVPPALAQHCFKCHDDSTGVVKELIV